MKKYKLTSNIKQVGSITLHQIQALKSFGNVQKGDIGGWIEKESNLSQEGGAWVYGNARVFGNARVCGDARVYGNALVYGNARVCGDARVFGNAQVYGDDWVYGNALVYGDAPKKELSTQEKVLNKIVYLRNKFETRKKGV